MAENKFNKRVYVHALKNRLNLTQLTGDANALNRWIIVPDINRPGLELSGYLESKDLKRVVILGNKEYEYMMRLSPDVQKQRFEIITDSYTPCIICSEKFYDSPVLFDLAKARNFPILKYSGETYQLIVDVVSYLSEELAPSDSLYGVMMNIYGKGIVLVGDPGIGKSELALDLIKKGHMLVADDRVDVTRVHNSLTCKAPDVLKKMLEIRGLGIVDITRLFGANTYLSKSNLDMIIKLVRYQDTLDNDRLKPLNEEVDILGIKKTQLVIPVTAGKSLSSVIEAAVTDYILRSQGINLNDEFLLRFRKEIEKNGEAND